MQQHNYPFNWPEFYQFRKKVINEIQNKKIYRGDDLDLHDLPVWPCIRVPSDEGTPKRSWCITRPSDTNGIKSYACALAIGLML